MKKILIVLAVLVIFFSGCRKGENAVTIDSITPSDEVSQRTNFTFSFSKPVVDRDSLDKWHETPLIQFEPFVKGKYKWISPSELRFYPEDQLLPSTEYEVSISPRIIKKGDYYLHGQRAFKFSTERIRIDRVDTDYRISEKEMGKARIALSFTFNYTINPSELQKFLGIRFKGGRSINFSIEQEKPSNILVAVSEPLELQKEYREIVVSVNGRLKPDNAGLSLIEDYERTIRLPRKKELVVESSYPETSRHENWITIKFSTPVNIEKLKNYMKISPEIEYRLERSNNYVSIHGDFSSQKSYEVLIKSGLPAMNGSKLKRDFSTTLRMGDLEPSFDFVHQGIYLQRSGRMNVGIESVNIDELELSVEKVYQNNLAYFLNRNSPYSDYFSSWDLKYIGKHIEYKDINIDAEKNEKKITEVDMSEYFSRGRKGIYVLQLWEPDRHWRKKIKWVIITDLGIVAKVSGQELRVYINSLKDLKPVKDVEVKLLSRNNQVLLEGVTDSKGRAVFKDYAEKTEGFSPMVVTARKGKDFSFMRLGNSRIDMGDFDVGGRPPVDKYEAFLYTDRGVYRPGDTLHLAAIIRDSERKIPPDFPFKVEINDPGQTEFEIFRGEVGSSGSDEFELYLPHYSKTGVYNARVLVADSIEIGRVNFKVEEFMPQRMKVKLNLDEKEYNAGDRLKAEIEGIMLFGPPASGRRVEVSLSLMPGTFRPKGYKNFTFHDNDKSMGTIKREIGDKELDAYGKAIFYYTLPQRLTPPSLIHGEVRATVFELGGRTVSATREFSLHPYPHYIGLNRKGEGYPDKGEKVDFEFVVLSPDGKKMPGCELKAKIYKINWNTVLERDSRGYYYKSVESRELISERTVHYDGNVSDFDFMPHHYGSYIVKLENPQTGASSSLKFYVSGWGYSPWAMSHPDRISIVPDRDSYKPGEKAEIQIQAPFSGRLLLTVERNGVMHERIVEMSENTATITLPLKENYKPNVYIAGILVRSNEGLEPYAPLRAFGVTPVSVESDENRLSVEVEAPEKIEPENTMEVSLRVRNGTGNTYVTVAAVDEGILQITNFRTPSPFNFFFGRRRLTVSTHDLYSLVLPELSRTEKYSSPGGGFTREGEERRLMPVTVRRVRSVALWSGIIRASRGYAKIKFKVPRFQGTLRLMAVAFDGDRFGSGEDKTVVSDPIVLTPTLPRFLSGKDEFKAPVAVYNGTGRSGRITVSMEIDGPAELKSESRITRNIGKGEEEVIPFMIKAGNDMGKVHFDIRASGNGEETEAQVDLPLRPASPLIPEYGAGTLDDNGKATINVDKNWIKETLKLQLIATPYPSIKMSEGLRFLLRYPHGCIEQTTSRVFPLLYFSDIAKAVDPDLFEDKSSHYFVSEGIDKLVRMQKYTGGFLYWPGGSRESEWGTLYATHFLAEAEKAGYQVPSYVLSRAANRIKNMIYEDRRESSSSRRWHIERSCYAVYILALLGKPDRSAMNYLKEREIRNISDYAQFLLAGAFALSGDMKTAEQYIPSDISPSNASRETGGNFNSGTKANALMLEVLVDVDPNHPSIPVLIKEIVAELKTSRYYTTQSTALGFMAVGKALSRSGGSDYEGRIFLDEEEIGTFTTETFRIERENFDADKIRIEIEGEGPCYYYWKISGIKKDANIREYDRQLYVRRRYLSEQGHPVSYSKIEQGQLLVAEITMKALTDNLDNVIITDMLPAGLEIENPRLQSQRVLPWIGSKSVYPEYMDIRDDRINIYLNLRRRVEYNFYYMLRAVTVGDFVLPPVEGEAMYDPAKSSVAGSGRIKVVESH